ncbi:hypothetical protein QJS10_CPB17g02488 [Acorus calamus]|uniref:Uncharacterized protein n=1 Tax=Acorus calamus TaxID=4465 RepID=A0AAV9CTU4_ACOCL|nr:hypothetical protein QJS10_CPB17g02488 [Acorus calamus]
MTPQPNPFGTTFSGAGSGFIRGGLSAYGEKFLGSSSEFMQSNVGIMLDIHISRYFSDPQYHFQVNDQYVRNKLKVVLFPFLHRGHWTRITEPVGGRLSYKPPIYDINAPDLYIPLMTQRGGSIAGYSGIWRICLHRYIFSCIVEDLLELLILLYDALDVRMHGGVLGENNEEGSLCRDEELRLKQVELYAALHGCSFDRGRRGFSAVILVNHVEDAG